MSDSAVLWHQVTCNACQRSFECTPEDDFYGATPTDGLCEPCFLEAEGVDPGKIVYECPICSSPIVEGAKALAFPQDEFGLHLWRHTSVELLGHLDPNGVMLFWLRKSFDQALSQVADDPAATRQLRRKRYEVIMLTGHLGAHEN